MAAHGGMSDVELRKKLIDFGYPVGPVTDSTRKTLQRKLNELAKGSGQKKKKRLSSYSSGEDEEVLKPTRETTAMQPPKGVIRNNGRKSTGPMTRRSSTHVPGLEPLPNAIGYMGASYSGQQQPTSSQTVPKPTDYTPPHSTRKDYDTGSDNDEWTSNPATTHTMMHHSDSLTKKNPLESHPKYKPFELLGLKPSSPDDGHLLMPRTSFRSNFARNLGEQRNGLRLLSGNGHQPTASTPTLSHQRSDAPMQRTAPLTNPTPQGEHIAWNSSHISKALLAVLVVFFAYLAYCYLGMRSTYDVSPQISSFEINPENRFPLCKDGHMPGVNCVVPADARTAMAALKAVVPRLTEEAVSAICHSSEQSRVEDLPLGAMSFQQVEQLLLLNGDPDYENTVANMRILVRRNPHWGVAVLEHGMSIADPPLPMLCYLRTRLLSVLAYLLFCIPVLGIGAGAGWLIHVYRRSQRHRELQIDALVCRIEDTLEAQCENGSDACVALSVLHDALVPQHERKRLEAVWDKAVRIVISQNPRARLEVRRMAGEEVPTLVMLPTSPSMGSHSFSHASATKLQTRSSQSLYPSLAQELAENADQPSNHPSSMTNFASNQENTDSPVCRRQRVWQGQAFETQEGSVNSLPYSPTPCLKIRKMFDPDSSLRGGEDEGAWMDRIRNAILEKCGESVNILHISVDKSSTEGCVYVKCASPMDAGRAYRALHGAWYDGNLVTVKYLHLKRYHERFPEAADSCIPLLPSNLKKLSLQGNWAQQDQHNSLECT